MVFLQKSAYFRGFVELLTPTIMGQKTRLEELYELARQHDLVHSKGEFATLIGMDGASLSHALKDDGRVSTANAILRAEHALMRAGVSLFASANGDGSMHNIHGNQNQNGVSQRTIDSLIAEMAAQREANSRTLEQKDATIDRLLSMLEKLQNK